MTFKLAKLSQSTIPSLTESLVIGPISPMKCAFQCTTKGNECNIFVMADNKCMIGFVEPGDLLGNGEEQIGVEVFIDYQIEI